MCRAMEKMRDETAHETSIKNALTMLEDGLPYGCKTFCDCRVQNLSCW